MCRHYANPALGQSHVDVSYARNLADLLLWLLLPVVRCGTTPRILP